MRRLTARGAPALLLLVVLLAACGGAAEQADRSATDTADVDTAGVDQGLARPGGPAGADESAPEDSGPVRVTPVEIQPPQAIGDRIIKEGAMTIEVDDGGFDSAHRALVTIARDLGGAVSATSSSMVDGATVGSITVRVPVDSYDDLLTEVADIGSVIDRDVSSQDVSGEMTDLESRLRHLRAQEVFYLGLLDDAQSVTDAIDVQDQLSAITSEIERIQGRRTLLDDRTAFSTLTVEVQEAGAPGPTGVTGGPGAPDLGEYLRVGVDAFVRVLGVLLLIAVATAPFTIPVGIVIGIWLLRRRARRADAGATGTAAVEAPRPAATVGAPDHQEP